MHAATERWANSSPGVAVDQSAVAARRAYAAGGGIMDGDTITSLVREHSSQPISRVARWIVGREVVQFRCLADTLFPLFQFDLATMSIRPGAQRVIAELAPAFDDMELAQWFVRRNTCLAGAMPVDLVDSQLPAVLAAARTDRFVLRG